MEGQEQLQPKGGGGKWTWNLEFISVDTAEVGVGGANSLYLMRGFHIKHSPLEAANSLNL